MVTAITDIMATTTTLAAVEGPAVRVGPFRAASVSHISMVRGTFMEGRTKTGDIDNICGGRFGGLLFLALCSLTHNKIRCLFLDGPQRREATASGQVVAGRLRRTRNTTKCDIEKFTMKLAMTANSFASHTGKSRTSTPTTSAAVLASHPAMPDATKVK